MTPDLRLLEIYTYPVKACAAIAHDRQSLDSCGLHWDRRWMLVDADGRFVSQRSRPALAVVRQRVTADALHLSVPSMPDLVIPLERKRNSPRQVQIWDDRCDGWDEGDEAARWFSAFLHADLRLVRKADSSVRAVHSDRAPHPAQTAFSDGFPLLIVSRASLDALNDRLIARGASPVQLDRFRPNLVVDGCAPFAEDTWRTIRIGEIVLDLVKPCARCAVPTVDQASGTIPDRHEPTATLNTFRRVDGKVMFGQNAIHRTGGMLCIGEAVEVIHMQ